MAARSTTAESMAVRFDPNWHRPRRRAPWPDGFLSGVESSPAWTWAHVVHALWTNLTRRVASGVTATAHAAAASCSAVEPSYGHQELYYWTPGSSGLCVLFHLHSFNFGDKYKDQESNVSSLFKECYCATTTRVYSMTGSVLLQQENKDTLLLYSLPFSDLYSM